MVDDDNADLLVKYNRNRLLSSTIQAEISVMYKHSAASLINGLSHYRLSVHTITGHLWLPLLKLQNLNTVPM